MVVEADDAVHSLYRAGTKRPMVVRRRLAGSKDGAFRNLTKQTHRLKPSGRDVTVTDCPEPSDSGW